MEIPENEIQDILGTATETDDCNIKRKKKRKSVPRIPLPSGVPPPLGIPPPTGATGSESESSLVKELVETKQRLSIVTEQMEGMRSEIDQLRMANPRPLKIFALGFIPTLVLAKSHVDMLKWVADVLSPNMKKRIESHGDHFSIISTVTGVDTVGVRTCPIFNRVEYCALKWHHMTKMGKSGRSRSELRIHCCTLCMEALGIICGHPLLKCPWIYEDTWKKITSSEK